MGEPNTDDGCCELAEEESLQIFSFKSHSEESPAIPQVGTFDSSSADDDVSMSNNSGGGAKDGGDVDAAGESPHGKPPSKWGEILHQLFYISTFGILGTVLRLYMGRIFGLDCELQDIEYEEVDDFLTQFSSQICVTSSGKTTTGGAIFTDLPANMLGS